MYERSGELAHMCVIPDGKEATADLAWARLAGLVEIGDDGDWKLTELGECGLMRVLEAVVRHPPAEGGRAFPRNRTFTQNF